MQVVTPVRRSARKPAKDMLPVSALLERTEYAYMPNDAMAPRMDLDAVFQQLSLSSRPEGDGAQQQT